MRQYGMSLRNYPVQNRVESGAIGYLCSRPLHIHTTMQPLQAKLLYTNVLFSIPICEIKIKKSDIGHQIF